SHAAGPLDADLDAGLRHRVRVDRVVRARDVARTRDTDAAAVRQLAPLLLPVAGSLDGVQALEEPVRRDAQLVDRTGVRAEEVAAAQLDRVDAERIRQLVQLHLE